MKRLLHITLAALSLTVASVSASEVSDLIAKLASEKETERADAIVALQKLGDAADKELKAEEASGKLTLPQLAVVRKLIGDLQVKKTTLKPLDLTKFKLKPFGEDAATGEKGDPNLLFDKDTQLIVMNGYFTLESGPLEYLVVSKGPDAKLHETVFAVLAKPRDICSALLVANYTYAGELGEDGKINLPKEAGVFVSVEFDWDGPHTGLTGDWRTTVDTKNKTTVRVPIEFLAWNNQTEKTMKRVPFAFTGSRFEKDPATGKMYFMADWERSIVAVRMDPNAVLNTPLDTREIDPQHAAGYAVNRFIMQKRTTPCRIIFEPWSGDQLTAADLTDKGIDKGPAPRPAPAPNAPEEKK